MCQESRISPSPAVGNLAQILCYLRLPEDKAELFRSHRLIAIRISQALPPKGKFTDTRAYFGRPGPILVLRLGNLNYVFLYRRLIKLRLGRQADISTAFC